MVYRDLFKGTAEYYAKYRPGYPDAFFADVVKRFKLDGTGRLLDLGAGTGQLSIPLSKYFREVIAMDPEPEMLAMGKREAKRVKVKNIRWVRGDSETLSTRAEKFTLVVMGRSFHWMDRDKILKKLYPLVKVGGGVIVVADADIRNLFKTKINSSWKKTMWHIVKKHLGEERRAGSGLYQKPPEKHLTVIKRSRFKRVSVKYYPVIRKWNIDRLVGYLYSTSFSSKAVLGKKRRTFERDLRKALRTLNPRGVFIDRVATQAIYMRK